MGASEIVTNQFRALDPAYVDAQRFAGWLTFGILMTAWAIVFGILLVTGEAGLRWLQSAVGFAGLLLAPLLIWLATSWPALSYRHWSYRLDETGIEIRSGVWFRAETTVPRSRVQHTEVSQGPVERRFGLGTLVIYTAGTEHARVALPGLRHEMAIWIRDSLLPKDGADAV